MKNKDKKQDSRFLMIEPIPISSFGPGGDQEENPVLKLQLTMATTSINHEYARLEFEETSDQDQKEALLEYMNECRQKYFEARKSLVIFDPSAAHDFEADLLVQKRKTMGQFNA